MHWIKQSGRFLNSWRGATTVFLCWQTVAHEKCKKKCDPPLFAFDLKKFCTVQGSPWTTWRKPYGVGRKKTPSKVAHHWHRWRRHLAWVWALATRQCHQDLWFHRHRRCRWRSSRDTARRMSYPLGLEVKDLKSPHCQVIDEVTGHVRCVSPTARHDPLAGTAAFSPLGCCRFRGQESTVGYTPDVHARAECQRHWNSPGVTTRE